MSLYPNPASSALNLVFDNVESGKLSIYNIFGKQVVDQSILNQNQTIVDISLLKSGLYILNFIDNKGNMMNAHFCKS